MRIALICEAFRSIGGIQEVVDNLAVQMLAAGHAVAIVATPYVTANARRTPAAAAEYFYLDVPSRKPVTWRHPERLLRQPQIAALVECFERWRPDVINSHAWGWDKIPIVIGACKAARVPLVQSLYDLWGEGRLGKQPLSMLTQAAALIALSEATKAALSRYSHAVRGAHVIVGGVDPKAAQSAEPYPWERPYIFCAARLDLRHKATDRLILGFAAAAAEFPAVDLLIAGDGPARADLEKLIERLGLASRVRLLGTVSRTDLWRYHKGALFFAMPSYMPEGLGLGFLEAMACGRPAVGTACGGVPEIIVDGQTGFLLRSNEVREIGEVLRRMLEDPQRCARMGELARESVAARFSWESVADQYLRVYRAVIAQRGDVALGT